VTAEAVSRKYVRAAGLIRARIADGTLRPGEPVPSGAALARVTGYSAPTCRHALRTLVEDGTLAPGPSANARPRVPVPASSPARQALSEAARALSSGLASRRRAAGLTQPALATLLGLSVTAVGHAETSRLWQSRDFWENADKVLTADGELLSLHDAWQAANAPVAAGNADGQSETSGAPSGTSSSPGGPTGGPGTGELRNLSDPEFFTRWAAVRNLLFSTPGDKPERREVKHLYDAVSAEYRRRTGGLAVTNVDYWRA
jgi:Bacterial regulatory proteins, gntR family/Helix-turn-helix domain